MRAVIFDRCGEPGNLRVATVDNPAPQGRQVLVRVHAASVNPADVGTVRGNARAITGLVWPRKKHVGLDVAGVVEAVGPDAHRFAPGDAVYGVCVNNPNAPGQAVWVSDHGSFAELGLTHEDALGVKPANLTFTEAAAIPSVTWTALQGLRAGGIAEGQKVLVYSVTGGIGTMAVQLAKALGAHVTGVCGAANADLVRSLGADDVVDYRAENYLKRSTRYDIILDSVGADRFSDMVTSLRPGGKVVVVSRRSRRMIVDTAARVASAGIASLRTHGSVTIDASQPDKDDLAFISDLLESGRIRPVIAQTFTGLDAVPEALGVVAGGHAPAKVVVGLIPDEA